MVLVYRQRIPQRLYNFFLFSILFHFGLVVFINTRKSISYNLIITEISYQEEALPIPEGIKPQARIGYLIPPKEFEPGAPSGAGEGVAKTTPVVNLNAHLDRSQAKIDIEQYESEDKGGLAIVRIADHSSGQVKSTEEILAEKPISLAKNMARGKSEGLGIDQSGAMIGQNEPSIIKIEKKSATATSKIGQQNEAKIEEKIKVQTNKTQISLAGPIAERAILKKLLPQYPQWCLSRGISGTVKVKISVSPNGTVLEGTLVVFSSGYADLDQTVINAIKKWLFAPLPSSVIQENQWGIVTFKFVCG